MCIPVGTWFTVFDNGSMSSQRVFFPSLISLPLTLCTRSFFTVCSVRAISSSSSSFLFISSVLLAVFYLFCNHVPSLSLCLLLWWLLTSMLSAEGILLMILCNMLSCWTINTKVFFFCSWIFRTTNISCYALRFIKVCARDALIVRDFKGMEKLSNCRQYSSNASSNTSLYERFLFPFLCFFFFFFSSAAHEKIPYSLCRHPKSV